MKKIKITGTFVYLVQVLYNIRLLLNIETEEEDEVDIYVICENKNLIRFYEKQGGIIFN